MSDSPLCSCTPEPPEQWVSGVCVKCWHWKYTPQVRADWERSKNARKVIIVRSGDPPVKRPLPCVHIGDDLSIDRIQDLGLNPRRKWHECEAGVAANRLGIVGVACVCEGCNPKCMKYEAGAEGE